MNEIRKFLLFWLNEEFFAVGFFSFIGVLIRVLIYNAFVGESEPLADTAYGPFIQMFYVQPYLLPNFLGCFCMAVFYVFKSELLQYDKSKGLLKGLTTGFCGSLTTFSSWVWTALRTLFTSDNWFKILAMIFLECWLTWASFIMGIAAAKYFKDNYYHYFLYQQVTTVENKENKKQSSDNADNGEILLQPVNDDDIERGNNVNETRKASFLDQINNPEVTLEELGRSMIITEGAKVELEEIDQRCENQNIVNVQKELVLDSAFKYSSELRTVFLIWFLLFTCTALSLWITLLCLPSIPYFKHRVIRRNTFRAICLAPLGAWLRWSFTRFPQLELLWVEMRPHTLLANSLGVLVQSFLFLYSTSSWTTAISYGKSFIILSRLVWMIECSYRYYRITYYCINVVLRIVRII
jgi:fluoride ion exporter CrcB/FEX